MAKLVRTLLCEPRAPGAPARVSRDWLLVGAMALSLGIEALARSESAFSLWAIPTMAVLIVAVLWRRTHPLRSVVAAFGPLALFNIVAHLTNTEPGDLISAVWILILGYSLFRWGSGREIAIGLGIMVGTVVLETITNYTGAGDAIGGTIFLLFPAALGASIRLQRTAQAQQTGRIRAEEREKIARELHDTVAHHVSAIAIQAQAGQFLTESDSSKDATNALKVIEEEASRTLVEMRSIVGLLRRGELGSERVLQHGFDGLDELAALGSEEALRVNVDRTGDLDAVPAPVCAAIFRLAQESITNATRHARNASRVEVRVHGDSKMIQLTITDDGDKVATTSISPGFGLIGMKERVDLLGGTVSVGPSPLRGWVLRAELPRCCVAP